MKDPRIGILTYHYIPNNGAFLFAYSLLRLLQNEFDEFNVNLIDYKSPRLAAFEWLKRFKLAQRAPGFYMKRARLWNEQIEQHLSLEHDAGLVFNESKFQQDLAQKYTMLVTGMDVWCVIKGTERPNFPNIYWLPEQTTTQKVAYGVSAYNSDNDLIDRSAAQIGKYLDGFDVIGARDRFTLDLVLRHRKRTDGFIRAIPDPTFTYDFPKTNIVEKLKGLGVDMDRPLLGLLKFGDHELSQTICDHYKAHGYQILAMSMYNPFADINLGHVLTPFEWAEAFRHLTFCITDRFHGTIFCMLNGTPFISLEKDSHLPLEQSKLFDLLNGFDLQELYYDPEAESFDPHDFLNHADEIRLNWENTFKFRVQTQVSQRKKAHADFLAYWRSASA